MPFRGAETGAADTAHNEQPVEVTESSVRALIARAESQIELVQAGHKYLFPLLRVSGSSHCHLLNVFVLFLSISLFRRHTAELALIPPVVQEAVLPLCGSDASTVSDGDAKFLDASVAALRAYQNDLEGAVNVLASHSSEATSRLMSECLKTVDALHTTMALHDEVMVHFNKLLPPFAKEP